MTAPNTPPDAAPRLPPPQTASYRRTPVFDADSIPAALKGDHSTKAGVWALIHVERGALRYRQDAPPVDVILTAGETLAVPPQAVHRVEPHADMAFFVEFWR